ncbi:hypothetical protein A1359_06425 [Methylomonas lenta]|uniref:Uncharacterized protein n=1 Tax=Methylomonas lenta TaxID=980561 RepID=A0A177NGU8_9GAMM|nr:hypothetical protein A1359_06425 [Methylomonas lenta]
MRAGRCWSAANDPKRPVALLQTGQSAKALEGYKAGVGDLTQSATFLPLNTPKIMEIECLLSAQNLTPTLYP